MIFDKAKILPLSMDRLSFSFLNGTREEQIITRNYLDHIAGYALRGAIKYKWYREGAPITILFGGTRSQAFIGIDGYNSWRDMERPSIQLTSAHALLGTGRVVLHEGGHHLGIKHQHEIADLLERDPDRFEVSHPNNNKSMWRYRLEGEGRNHYMSKDDTDFYNNYNIYREMGEDYRKSITEDKLELILADKEICICDFD